MLTHSDLHTTISAILARETSVLDPDDADSLAAVLVNDLPAVYKAAPELLTLLHRLLYGVLAIPELPPTIAQLDIEQARAAINKATGH